VSPEYSHDSLNLISDQEMSNFLKVEVVEKAWMEKSPRTITVDDSQMWIIGAVLGSLFVVLTVIWILGYIYYRWVRPRRPTKFDKDTPMPRKAREILQEKPTRVTHASKSKAGKIEPFESSLKTKIMEHHHNGSEHSGATESVAISTPPKQRKKTAEKARQLHSAIKAGKKEGAPTPNDTSYRISDIAPAIEDNSIKIGGFEKISEIQRSIISKSEIERWRNKQRKREKLLRSESSKERETSFYQSEEYNDEQKIIDPKSRIKISNQIDDTFNMLNQELKEKLAYKREMLDEKKVSSDDSFVKPKHEPVKVHVAHRPTERDVSHVPNPYDFQDEYARYAKDGFVFEPISKSGSQINANKSSADELSLKVRSRSSSRSKRLEPIDASGKKKHSYVNVSYENDIKMIPRPNKHIEKETLTDAISKFESNTEIRCNQSNAYAVEPNRRSRKNSIQALKSASKGPNSLELIGFINKEIDRIKFDFNNESSNA